MYYIINWYVFIQIAKIFKYKNVISIDHISGMPTKKHVNANLNIYLGVNVSQRLFNKDRNTMYWVWKRRDISSIKYRILYKKAKSQYSIGVDIS